MAMATKIHAGGSGIALLVGSGLHGLMRRLEERRTYRRTVAELSRLGDRELNDLGISRYDITRVARSAAYGAAD